MKIKIIPERVYESGSRHSLQADEIWYSYFGGEAWGTGEDGQPRIGKLVSGEEYEIEYEVTKSKKDGKEYNTIKGIKRLTYNNNEDEPKSGTLVPISGTGQEPRQLPAIAEKRTEKEATVENQISALVPTAGTLQVSKENQEVLLKDIPDEDVEIRPDGLIYAPWEVYATRLNKIFGLAWAMIPVSFKPDHLGIFILWGFSLVIQGKFAGYTIGQQEYIPENRQMTWGDACEGAKSNALMRLCKGLGIGLNLWRPSYIKYWKEKYAESYVAEVRGKEKTLWRKRGQINNSMAIPIITGDDRVITKDVIDAEVTAPEENSPRLTTSDPCTKKQQIEIRDLIGKVADSQGINKKEVSAGLTKKFKFSGFDQVNKERAEEIKECLKGQIEK